MMSPDTFSTGHKHLLLAGAGHAHLIALLRLLQKRQSHHKWHITLISPQPWAVYSGMLPGYIAGHYREDDIRIPLPAFCQRANAQFIQADISGLHPDKQTLEAHTTHLNGEGAQLLLPYDLLSLNTGAIPDLHSVPGAFEHAIPVKPLDRFMRHWQRLLHRLEQGGSKQHIVLTGAGAAGVELALAIAFRIREQRFNAHVSLVSERQILSGYPERTRTRIYHWLNALGVAVHEHNPVTQVTSQQVIRADHSRLDYDHLIWCTGSHGAPWLQNSPLALDDKGFIPVTDQLNVVGHRTILAAGDCATLVNQPLPKAGVYAVRQGKTLGDNLHALMHDAALRRFEGQARFLSILAGGSKQAAASRGAWLQLAGTWVWYWKDYIDRGFLKQFR